MLALPVRTRDPYRTKYEVRRCTSYYYWQKKIETVETSPMSTQRGFSAFDLLRFNNVNLDPLTETYHMGFYLQYLAKWPEYCFTAEGPGARIMGYILGKAESFPGVSESWHGHVTAVTVSPEYRRLGLATKLMDELERVSELDKGYFVDL